MLLETLAEPPERLIIHIKADPLRSVYEMKLKNIHERKVTESE
jgi:hypothetical protein